MGSTEKFENPPEFKDDERWLKIFSAKSAVVFVSCVSATIFLYKLLAWIGGGMVALCIGIPVTLVAVFLTSFTIPEESYLKGGGQTLDSLLAKRYIRWKNRKILVKGYREES